MWWKRSYYEASAGVPLLIRVPDVEHQQINVPVELVDLFPTICDLAQIDTPPDLDGESLLPLLTGDIAQRKKQTVRSELLGGNPNTRFRMVRNHCWKYVDFPDALPRLYDLSNDPDEQNDLIDSPGDAPAEQLQNTLNQGGTWESLEADYEKWQKALTPYKTVGNSATQFRLANGRIIEADDHLYDGSSL